MLLYCMQPVSRDSATLHMPFQSRQTVSRIPDQLRGPGDVPPPAERRLPRFPPRTKKATRLGFRIASFPCAENLRHSRCACRNAAAPNVAISSLRSPSANHFIAVFGYVGGWRALQVIDLTSSKFSWSPYEPRGRWLSSGSRRRDGWMAGSRPSGRDPASYPPFPVQFPERSVKNDSPWGFEPRFPCEEATGPPWEWRTRRRNGVKLVREPASGQRSLLEFPLGFDR